MLSPARNSTLNETQPQSSYGGTVTIQSVVIDQDFLQGRIDELADTKGELGRSTLIDAIRKERNK